MRSVWCTLVAVTLVVAGARVGSAGPRHAAQTDLHVAKTTIVAPAVRRAQSKVRALDALVAVAAIELPAPARSRVPSDRRAAVSQPLVRSLFVRSSRGPPRA